MPLSLAERFGLGQLGIALFASAGAGGALAAPLAGRLSDRGYIRMGTSGALLAAVAAFLMSIWAVDLRALLLLGVAAVLLDAATQFNQVFGQRVLCSPAPEARGRINASHMMVVFVGVAAGSTLASYTFYRGGWSASPWTQVVPEEYWPAFLSRICAAPTVSTPGRVQPGNGIGRSCAPVASITAPALTTSALPPRLMNANAPASSPP